MNEFFKKGRFLFAEYYFKAIFNMEKWSKCNILLVLKSFLKTLIKCNIFLELPHRPAIQLGLWQSACFLSESSDFIPSNKTDISGQLHGKIF